MKQNFRDADPFCRQVELVPLRRVLADGELLVGVEDEVGGVLLEGGLVLGQPLLLCLAVGVARVLNAKWSLRGIRKGVVLSASKEWRDLKILKLLCPQQGRCIRR